MQRGRWSATLPLRQGATQEAVTWALPASRRALSASGRFYRLRLRLLTGRPVHDLPLYRWLLSAEPERIGLPVARQVGRPCAPYRHSLFLWR